MSEVHIALQQHHAILLILHNVILQLSNKVVALLLDNSAGNALLCYQGCTVSLFLSRLACHILNLANMPSITFIPVYIPTHLNVEANYLSLDQLVPKWHLIPHVVQVAYHLWDQLEMNLLASSCTKHGQNYYTLEDPLLLEGLGLNAVNYPWTYQVDMCFLLHLKFWFCLSSWQNVSNVSPDSLFSTCLQMFFVSVPL